jgi:hypothetical protein
VAASVVWVVPVEQQQLAPAATAATAALADAAVTAVQVLMALEPLVVTAATPLLVEPPVQVEHLLLGLRVTVVTEVAAESQASAATANLVEMLETLATEPLVESAESAATLGLADATAMAVTVVTQVTAVSEVPAEQETCWLVLLPTVVQVATAATPDLQVRVEQLALVWALLVCRALWVFMPMAAMVALVALAGVQPQLESTAVSVVLAVSVEMPQRESLETVVQAAQAVLGIAELMAQSVPLRRSVVVAV